MKVVITNEQKKQLEKLWFIYGNGGSKHTLGNHKFIQNLLTDNEDYRSFYRRRLAAIHSLTDSCMNDVDKILDNFKIGDRVSIQTNAIHQETQIPMNKWRGKIVDIKQNSYIVLGLNFKLPFAGNELIKL